MADVKIRMRPNGPLVIEGPFELVDSRGQRSRFRPTSRRSRSAAAATRPSGRSATARHKTCGFVSDEAPTPPAVGLN